MFLTFRPLAPQPETRSSRAATILVAPRTARSGHNLMSGKSRVHENPLQPFTAVSQTIQHNQLLISHIMAKHQLDTMRDLYLNELRDLYNAENQLLEALPKMTDAATNPELKTAFSSHLKETQGHVNRLEEIFRDLDQKPEGETCEAMKGLIKEGEEFVKSKGDTDVLDAALIGAAQRVEHYEMAGYGVARNLALHLGETGAVRLLEATLEEEKEADSKLTKVAENSVHSKAA